MLSPIADILEDLRQGRGIVLVDDEDRENEGDLVFAAQSITPEQINFTLKHARGVICLAMTGGHCDRLGLHPQVERNTATLGTAFTVTVDAHPNFGVTTGVSAKDRAKTIQVAIAPNARPEDLLRPGHINPLRARDGGVLVRAGQTEGSVDLCLMAGLTPAAVICEIMREDGEMARAPELEAFCRQNGMKMCSVADLIRYRLQSETLVRRVETVDMPTRWGKFKLAAYETLMDPEPHLVLFKGNLGRLDAAGKPIFREKPVLVRVHSECLTGDVLGSLRCDCGEQLGTALAMIEAAGEGALVYLRQEGRGIGLQNKLHAYRLQEEGRDTVEANTELGFPADKRDYGIGSQILRDMGIRTIRLLSNNPKKIHGLEAYGLKIAETVPLVIPPRPENARYLATKKAKLGHKL